MSHTTVFIILDAARADAVARESMPFLHGLGRDSVTGAMDSPPGFAQRTVLFTGRYPDTSGNFSQFVYDPVNSPFQWVRRLGPLRALVRPRRFLVPTRWGIGWMTKRLTGVYHPDPAWIPPRYLPFFRPCEDMRPLCEPGALGAPSIFDLCRAHGLTYRYLAHPVSGDDDAMCATLVRELRARSATDLFVAQLSATDEKAHHHGPLSEHMRKRVLPKVDRQLASVHAALTAAYDSWDLFVIGDHGMAPVERRVNVLDHLRRVDARPAVDYVVFVNSTLAVFWYLTERGRREIEAALPAIPGTTLVSDEDRHRLRIPVHRRWGHRMLAAQPGVLFWPDYFHVTDSTIRGMHGYLDKRDETHGLCVLASSRPSLPRADVGVRPLVDVFPTLCHLLGVPVPTRQEGTTLLQRKAPGIRVEVTGPPEINGEGQRTRAGARR